MNIEVEETLKDGTTVKRKLDQSQLALMLNDLNQKTDPDVQIRLGKVWKELKESDEAKKRKSGKSAEEVNAIDAEYLAQAEKQVAAEVRAVLEGESSAGSPPAPPAAKVEQEQAEGEVFRRYLESVANMNLPSFSHLQIDALTDVAAHPNHRALSFDEWVEKRFGE